MRDARALRAGLLDMRDALAHMRTPWRPTSDEYVSGNGFASRPPVALGIIDAEVAARRALRVLYQDTVADTPRFQQYPPSGTTPGQLPLPLIRARAEQGTGTVRRPPRTLPELLAWCLHYAEFVADAASESQLEYLLDQLLPSMQSMAGFTTQIDRTMGILTDEVNTRRNAGLDPDVYLSAQRVAKLSLVTVNRRTIARWADQGHVKARVGADGQREVSVVDVVARCESLADQQERTKADGRIYGQDVGDSNG